MGALGFCVDSVLGLRIRVAFPHDTCFLIACIGYSIKLCRIFLGTLNVLLVLHAELKLQTTYHAMTRLINITP